MMLSKLLAGPAVPAAFFAALLEAPGLAAAGTLFVAFPAGGLAPESGGRTVTVVALSFGFGRLNSFINSGSFAAGDSNRNGGGPTIAKYNPSPRICWRTKNAITTAGKNLPNRHVRKIPIIK
jgi:hypothetical protein